jgi:sugar phosphate isomerase/epimerase
MKKYDFDLPGNHQERDRRSFLKAAGLGALAFSFPFPALPAYLKGIPMGIVVHSYGARWNSDAGSKHYPGFQNALDLIQHCHRIGAGGVQVGVNNWSLDFAKQVRIVRENLGLYLEGSISLPKGTSDLERFEQEVVAAKEAGATVLRTVCLSGRRYENFQKAQDWEVFKTKSLESIRLAEPIARRHRMKLGVENHKDWKAAELASIIQNLSSEWVGVTLDFGNNLALLEESGEVIKILAPYVCSTHIKDMAVKPTEGGFLLSEVPLGKGIVDLKSGIELCQKYNPTCTFSLEMITRDPLVIPCVEDQYWTTFGEKNEAELEKIMNLVSKNKFEGELPSVQDLDAEQRLQLEEENNLACLKYSSRKLRL